MRDVTAVSGAVRRRLAWLDPWYAPLTCAFVAVLAAVAVWRMETSAADFDPQFMRVVVERTIRYGGGYYENAIHNKGPLEPFVFESARRLGGADGFWLVIAWWALVAAGCVAAAAAAAARCAGAARWVAAAVAVAVGAHLTLSESDYAGVLYARNLVVALLSVAFVAATLDSFWASERHRRAAAVTVGVTTGLAVQTLLTAAFTASPVLLYAMWVRRRERVAGRPACLLMCVVSAAAFGSAIVYYGLADLVGVRSFGDFWEGWWTYARFMSEATGRGLGGQIELGRHRFVEYYGDRPVVAVTVVVWLVAAGWRVLRRGDPAERARVAVLGVWFAGAWVELVVSQRYSSHYFSVLAAPTLLIAAQLTGWATAGVRRLLDGTPGAALLVPAAAVLTIQAGGTRPFGEGIEKLATQRSPAALAAARDAGLGGRIHFQRGVMSLFSEPGDPLLSWTSYPWVYLEHDRTSATRYIWKTFLVGEIYLAGRSDEYVLPGTWERWETEATERAATAYLVESHTPVEPGTPFERFVSDHYQTVWSDADATLALRADLADWLLGAPAGAVPGALQDAAVVSDIGCVRVDGTLPAGTTRFRVGPGDTPALVEVTIGPDGGGSAQSQRHGVAGFATAVPPTTGQAPVAFTLVSGDRATVLVVGGRVVAAVERGGRLAVEGAGAATLAGNGYTVAPVHPLSGC